MLTITIHQKQRNYVSLPSFDDPTLKAARRVAVQVNEFVSISESDVVGLYLGLGYSRGYRKDCKPRCESLG